MNRYGRGPNIRGPSKATASTLCQKCLIKGHYSYECKAVAQDRPYVSRPSRTQQLFDPKLVPKLTNAIPNELLRKKGIADEQLAKSEEERGQKRRRRSEESTSDSKPKRLRSASISSASVSTISTVSSSSPPPRRAIASTLNSNKYIPSLPSHTAPIRSRPIKSPNLRRGHTENKRRRESSTSADSYSSDGGQSSDQRAIRRRYRSISPPLRGRPIESRSQVARHRRQPSHDPYDSNNSYRNSGTRLRESKPIPKERSLSPFSKRLALTQALNSGK